MERYTQKNDRSITVDPERMEGALARLAAFEDMAEGLEQDQENIARTLEELRSRGKDRTVQFKELLARKLVNNNMKLLLERYGIKL
ncbi:MAG: hypothetical protein SOZ47_01525 [Lawsonibacter sp.]|nr:hypothetical protein [Lawsonibacter sp.]